MDDVGEFLVLLTFYSCDRTNVAISYVILRTWRIISAYYHQEGTKKSYILVKSKLTAISCLSPITNENAQTRTGFGIVSQNNTNRLFQIAATVTCLLDASLEMKVLVDLWITDSLQKSPQSDFWEKEQLPTLPYDSDKLECDHDTFQKSLLGCSKSNTFLLQIFLQGHANIHTTIWKDFFSYFEM